MHIINGVEVLEGAYLLEPNIEYKVSVYTDDHTITTNETGHTLVMNSSSNKTFTLPSPSAALVGIEFTLMNINTGRLTVAVAGTGAILNGGTATTGTMYSDDDKTAVLKVRLVSATQWSVLANGTWTTT